MSAPPRLLFNDALYREVIQDKLVHARETVWIATANLKAMMVEQDGEFVPVVQVFSGLASRGVALRLLHAELPSRPFRRAFDQRQQLVRGGLELKICPRVHFKCVIVDGGWIYLGSANLTGAGLGAKGPSRRNFEIGITSEDFSIIDPVSELFESIWTGAECGACGRRDVCPDPIGEADPNPRATRRRRSIRGMWKSKKKAR